MLKKYFLWVSLSVLGLAGCSHSERPPETAGTPAATSPGPLASSAATQPAPPASSGLPSADTLAPSPAPGSTEATRLLALLEGPRRRHATTLAAATPDEPASRGEDSAPDSARTAELRRFLQAGLPAAQLFTVYPGRDTLLMGTQGTQVLVPAHAWDLADSTAVVQLALQEFYTPADIILAGLSTTAGPQLLETGGMVHLTATANGQPVQLLPGRPVLLRLPARRAQPGMQLFEGVVRGRGQAPDWQLPVARGATATATQPGQRAVVRPGRRALVRPGQHKSKQELDSLYIPRPIRKWPAKKNFPLDLAGQVRGQLPNLKRLRRSPHASQSEKNLLDRLSINYDRRIVRQVYLRFALDSAGMVGLIEPLPGSDLELSPTAVAALRQLAPWQPANVPYFGAGQTCTEHVAAQGRVRVIFSKLGQVIVTPPTWAIARASQPRAKQRQHEVDSLLASPALRRRYLHQQDSVAGVRRVQEQVQWAKNLVRTQAEEARRRTQFTDTSRAALTQAGVSNELWASGLGWINCDRFVGIKPLLTYQVRVQQRDAIVNLVFQGLNSVVRGAVSSDAFVNFISVPRKQRAIVVALRRENGITYLAKQRVQLTEMPLMSLSYHPVTMAQLRAELAR
jgi:hypothetical protein